MDQFKYLGERIIDEPWSFEPFPHLVLENFLNKEHFDIVVNNDQIHFEEQLNTQRLMQTLITKDYKVQDFPGCTISSGQYLLNLMNNDFGNNSYGYNYSKSGMKVIELHSACEAYGITYRLHKIKNDTIKELVAYMNSEHFHNSIKKKFEVVHSTTIVSAIQKNLTKYEISPHPDIRQKCMTYLLNINKDDSVEKEDVHTHLLQFKESKKFLYEYWEKCIDVDRFWVPWDWCDTKKIIRKNNCMVMFKTSNDTLHGIKMDYDHLKWQRTQIYGNLMYKDPVHVTRQGSYEEHI